MTDYDRIVSSCLETGVLWEDPDFPATQNSVFYHQTPPFNFVWKRPSDIYAEPHFVVETWEAFDVIPGKLGDNWLVSCLGMLYLHKGLFKRVVPANQKMTAPYAGVFRFRLWWCGQWMEVLVDDRLPTVNGRLAFLQTNNTVQLWPALLEKAYAKLHGSYEALKYTSLLDGLAEFTGGITETLRIPRDPDDLMAMLQNTSLVTAYHDQRSAAEALKAPFAELQDKMNYKVCSVEKIDTGEGPTHLVRLRRPVVPWETARTLLIQDQAILNSIHHHELKRLKAFKGFWMEFNEFRKAFVRLELVHLAADIATPELSGADRHAWQSVMHQSGWRRGVSAGGCRNHEDFHLNPQYQLVLTESEVIIISLNQHSVMEPKVIGFSIYKIPKCLTEIASSSVFKKTRTVTNSQYTNSRQVSHRCELEAGVYLVVPTTYYPRAEANFTLRVYSCRPVKMDVLDYTPQMLKDALVKAPGVMSSFSQYEAVFLQIADEHRTIDAFELQELLDKCLPNDYIKSCATIDTCRQIVLAMDNTGTGRISLADFKDLICSLKHWQVVFKTHAREKMGVLRAESLREALHEIGFKVNERAMVLIVQRYMRKDGMLRFGDFVSAIVRLHRVFNVFFTSDSPYPKTVRFTLQEWLTNALVC